MCRVPNDHREVDVPTNQVEQFIRVLFAAALHRTPETLLPHVALWGTKLDGVRQSCEQCYSLDALAFTSCMTVGDAAFIVEEALKETKDPKTQTFSREVAV